MQSKGHPPGLQGRIIRLAQRQQGMVSRAQLLSLGLGPGAIVHRTGTGRLARVARGVYSVGVASQTQEARWLRALLACPPGSVASHLSAGAVWELREVDPVTIDVSVPSRSGKRRDGVRLHRPRHLEAEDVARHRGIPVTTVPRTLIDMAEMVSSRSLERALDEAQYLKLLDQREIDDALRRHRGRAGAARLAAVLRRQIPGTTRTRSPLEEAFLLLVRGAQLPQPEINVRLGTYTVDFLWREAGLVVETDGRASHDRPAQRERDSRRDAWLAAAGYRTERFTRHQVIDRPGEVLAVLDAVLPAVRS